MTRTRVSSLFAMSIIYTARPFTRPAGRLTIWKEPVIGESYSLGLDCALGILGQDLDGGVMLDSHHEQVATIHGHFGTEVVGPVKELANAYGRGRVFIVGEAAKEAIPVMRTLYDAGYWLYYARADQSKSRTPRDMLGHVPVQWDPPVRMLQDKIRAGVLTIRDAELHGQLCRFGFRPKSARSEATGDSSLTWGAPSGEHDDLVRACALACFGLEWLPQFAPPKVELPLNSIGKLLGYDKINDPEPRDVSPWR